jgi:predicted GNAT superfamily acetyltransferase
MPAIEIRDADGSELVAGCELLARSLGFADRDALPPWLAQTAVECGGLALGAFRAQALVGFSVAIPAASSALFSCGLAVDPSCRGQGIGRTLKLAQRERALQRGCTSIRWTADPLAAPALGLYLAGLGARLVEYGTELYAAVRPSAVPPDDVTIDWPLAGAAPTDGAPGLSVEIPFDLRTLNGPELLDWRLRVRRSMSRALERGAVGTGVALDRGARRAWVLFSQPA